jgi:hypothetical protein
MVCLPDHRFASRLLSFSRHSLLSVSINQLHNTDAPSRRRTSPGYALCNALSHSPTASRGIPSLSTTASQSKNHPRVQPSPCIHLAPSTLLRSPTETAPARAKARAGLRTVYAMLNAAWPVLLTPLSFLLTSNLSDFIFGDILGALQTRSGRRVPRLAHLT